MIVLISVRRKRSDEWQKTGWTQLGSRNLIISNHTNEPVSPTLYQRRSMERRDFRGDGHRTIWDNGYPGKTPQALRFRHFCNSECGICDRCERWRRGSDLGNRAGADSRSGDHRIGSNAFVLRRGSIGINRDFGRRSARRSCLGAGESGTLQGLLQLVSRAVLISGIGDTAQA